MCIRDSMKSRRRGMSWDQFSINQIYKSLDMNLVSIKKHESILSKNEPTFLFLGEVIPITNQRTDSHPCIRFLHPMFFNVQTLLLISKVAVEPQNRLCCLQLSYLTSQSVALTRSGKTQQYVKKSERVLDNLWETSQHSQTCCCAPARGSWILIIFL